MSDPLLELDAVHFRLDGNAGPVNIINGITLDVRSGTTVAITGPSGSGKSSLLMLMAGLEIHTAGIIRLFGQDIRSIPDRAFNRLRRSRIGVVFQSFHLIPTMTARENIALPLELDGRVDAFERASVLLESVGLADRAGHYPAQLSGGEQQRVAIARAMVHGPQLILADEPTGNLDQTTGQAIMDLLFAMRAQHGGTLVMVTHSRTLAERCDTVVRIMDGRLKPQPDA
ncbi:MAG: ABC transporter ATP-binding protein [Rhodobacteraceae bacterium]|nr:ABC transporter ATP-binding protein [Paracoccaceae bacterium]